MDKVAETLAAVDRGEAPGCPFCGAKYIGDAKTTFGRYVWGCATMYGRTQDYYEEDIWLRTETCFNSEIAALRDAGAALVRELIYDHPGATGWTVLMDHEPLYRLAEMCGCFKHTKEEAMAKKAKE